MRVFLVLLVSIFPGANTISCPDRYTDGGDGSCYNWNIWSPIPRDGAYGQCAGNNAYITDVSNGFQNTAIANNFGSVDFGWLGLTCLNNSVTSCTWDNGIPMTSSSYSNFDAGHPIPQTGPCVVMAVKTGKWYSADCSNTYAYFGCKYTPNVNVPSCASYFTAFHGKCYCTIAVNSAEDATWDCPQYRDAVQTSIHSDGENAFVKGLATRYTGDVRQNQLFLGIQQNRTWTDGTAEDYENYGYKNSALGSCTSMSLYDDLVPAGMWISSQCSANSGSYAYTVCKKDPVEPTQAPTMAPPQCSGTQFLSGYGTVYSPSYPLGSEPNHCEFLITEDDGYQAQITLKYLQLDRNSTIQLFSGLFDKTPFQTLTNINFYSQTYWSPSNVLKIVYDTAGSENNKNLWTGDYQPIGGPSQTSEVPTGDYSCGDAYYSYSGTVNNENFPYSYPQITRNCSYILESFNGVCFTFDTFDIRYYDYVYLYDGAPDHTYTPRLMETFSGGSRPDGIYCTSHTSEMWIVFSTFQENSGQVTGWKGRFAGDSTELLSTTPYY